MFLLGGESAGRDGGVKRTGDCFTLMLIGLLVGLVFVCSNQMTAYAASSANQGQAKEVEEFARRFFEYRTKDRIDNIWDMLGDDKDTFIAHYRAWLECGFVRYDVSKVSVYPLKESGKWYAVVVYDLIVEDIDVPLPGLESMLVQEQADGSWLIFVSGIDVSSYEEIYQLREVLELMNEVNEKFYDVLMEYPEVMEWIQEAEKKQSTIMKQILSGDYIWEEVQEDTREEDPEEFYEVQKGDCLWHIAETKLGDGARWGELYEANRDVIGDDPNWILVGTQLLVP